jgi:hypothetical protein
MNSGALIAETKLSKVGVQHPVDREDHQEREDDADQIGEERAGPAAADGQAVGIRRGPAAARRGGGPGGCGGNHQSTSPIRNICRM